MPEPSPRMNIIIGIFSYIPLIIYFFVAVLLTIIAVVSLYDAAQLIWNLDATKLLPVGSLSQNLLLTDGIVKVVNAILLTITIIVLFETVTVYFRTKHVPVRALLIAGLTGTIREILIINYSTGLDPLRLFATVGILAVLIAGVVLVKED
jgi:uncharacterized membrane protein (DUF373 family)